MSIETKCPGCSAPLSLQDDLAGKHVRCQSCFFMFVVPQPSAPAEPELAEPVEGAEEPIVVAPVDAPDQPNETKPAPAAEAEDVVEGQVVKPVSKGSAASTPKPPRKKPEPQSSGLIGLLASIAAFLFVIFGVGGFALAWVAWNLTPPTRADFGAPPQVGRIDAIAKDLAKGKDFWDKKKADKVAPPERIVALPLDAVGRASLRGDNLGGQQSYRVFLLAGKSYNMLVTSADFAPRVEINGPMGPTVKEGEKSVLLNFSPRQQGEYTIHVSSKDPRVLGVFGLEFSAVKHEVSPRIDVAAKPEYTSRQALRISDPAQGMANPDFGTFRGYVLPVVAGQEYDIKLESNHFRPVLRYSGNLGQVQFVEKFAEPGARVLDFTYKAPFSRDLLMYVTSEDHGLGDYTLTVTRKMVAAPKNAPPEKAAPPLLKMLEKQAFPHKFELAPIRVGDLTAHKAVPFAYYHQPAWSLDGKSFFVAQSQNRIIEVDGQDFAVRQSRTYLDKDPTWFRGGLCWSSEGLLALGCNEKTRGEDMGLMIIDPKTLQVKKKIPCPRATFVASAPNLAVAFVGGKSHYGGPDTEFLAVDLKSGAVMKPETAFPISHLTFQVSPDGKHFFGTDGKLIARFRIDGTKLTLEETKVVIHADRLTPRLEMSVDGKHVWLLGQDAQDKHVPNGARIHALVAADFKAPGTSLEFPAYSMSIEPTTKAFVMTSAGRALTFRVESDKIETLDYEWNCETPRRIFMNPRGGSLLLHCDHTVYHVQWPTKDAKAPVVP